MTSDDFRLAALLIPETEELLLTADATCGLPLPVSAGSVMFLPNPALPGEHLSGLWR
jgi:hypothetical protein